MNIAFFSVASNWIGFFKQVFLLQMGPSKGRGPLIAKFAPVGFKKGFGAVGLGKHTKKGTAYMHKCLHAHALYAASRCLYTNFLSNLN